MPKGKVIGLGGAGDGIVETRDGKVFVPFVLPGETAEFELDETGKRGRAVRTESPSADRVAPVCPHFGTCGGCALQHMSEAAYRRFKLSALERALPAGAEPFERDDPVFVPARSRRRVSFALLWNGKLRLFGLNEAKSSRIVSVESCAQLVPELEKLISPLRKFLTEGDLPFGAKKGVGDVSVLQADNGADIISPDVFPNADRPWWSKLTMAVSGRMMARKDDGRWGYKVMRNAGYSYNSHPKPGVY